MRPLSISLRALVPHARTLLLTVLVTLGAACSPDRPRNVLLISIDTLRSDMLGCYGYDRPTSPNLDRLAAEGALFLDVTSTSPWTLPSHASLLTGLYPTHHGLKSHDRKLPESITTWAEVLTEHGFRTAAIVNSHYVGRRYGFDRGFAEFSHVRENPGGWRPSHVERLAIQWLKVPQERPFFLFLHFYDVHSDYAVQPEYREAFVRPYAGPVDGSTEQLKRFRQGKFPLDAEDTAHLVDLYVASIRQMDDGIGRILGVLEERGLADDTLVIVTSDHGEEFLEHGGVLHGRTQFQEVMRIPLVFRGPGVEAGLRVETPLSLADVMPTALAALGVGDAPLADGVDASPLLRGRSMAELNGRVIFGEADHNNEQNDITRSVRYQKFKLTYNRLTDAKTLYDLESDPTETEDVQSQHTYLVDLLRERLQPTLEASAQGEMLPSLTAEQIEMLGALGYLGDAPPRPAGGARDASSPGAP